jgi:hypothetical protein
VVDAPPTPEPEERPVRTFSGPREENDVERERIVEYSIEVHYYGKRRQAPDQAIAEDAALHLPKGTQVFRRFPDERGREGEWDELEVTTRRAR